MLLSGSFSGASLARRAGRSGLAMNGMPKATASALPSASQRLACSLVKRSLAMYTPPNSCLSCGPRLSAPSFSRAQMKAMPRLPSSRAT
ncbi:hypothetical protein D3C81_1811910 [compost metagenome]